MEIAALALMASQMKAASLSQGIGTAVAAQQTKQDRAVVDLLAGAAATPAPAPPGQGKALDIQV